MSGPTVQVAWLRAERGTCIVRDREALLLAARECRAEHGEPPDALPPRAAVDSGSLPDHELADALRTLLACGHKLSGIPGLESTHANTLVSLKEWPPWPSAEEIPAGEAPGDG
jgi:hypothetical protein